MSSHHIVRENQEPALFVVDVEAINEELLGQLLEWSPIVMTTNYNLDFFYSRNIKVDVILDTTASIPLESDLFTVLRVEQNRFLPAVYNYLKSRNQFSINILWNDFMTDSVSSGFTTVNYSRGIRYISTSNFEKWFPKNQKIVIKGDSLEIIGLKKLEKEKFETLEDGFVRVYSEQLFLIGEIL